MKFPDGRLLIFAKAPVPGQAKTRLIPVLGPAGAARLQKRFCRDMLASTTAAGLAPVELWCSPDTTHPFFASCRADYGVALRTQRGADLGERMRDAFERALASSRYAAIIGTDCPGIGRHDLRQTYQALDDGMDAVLGPALDGGYVLIGLSRPAPMLFAGVDWGSDRVLAQTRKRLAQYGLRWRELAPHRDVDRPEDLALLAP